MDLKIINRIGSSREHFPVNFLIKVMGA